DHPAEQVRDVLAAHGVKLVQFNCPMGNFAQGDRGLTCVPGREAEFRESVDRAIGYATALGVRQVNCVGGLRPTGAPDSQLEDVMVSNLRYAAPRFADAGVRLQIEPINPIDNPGVFFQTTAQFERVYERV